MIGPGTYNPQLSQIEKNSKVIVKYPPQKIKADIIKKERLNTIINELKTFNENKFKNDIEEYISFKINNESHFFKSKSRKNTIENKERKNHPGPCSYDPKYSTFLKFGTRELPSFSKSRKFINFINKDNSFLYQTKLEAIPSVGTYFSSRYSKIKDLKKIKLTPEFKSKCNRDIISSTISFSFPGPGTYSIENQSYSINEGSGYLI